MTTTVSAREFNQNASAALRLLAWLRSLPVLSSLARAVPPHWQSRIKSWLVK